MEFDTTENNVLTFLGKLSAKKVLAKRMGDSVGKQNVSFCYVKIHFLCYSFDKNVQITVSSPRLPSLSEPIKRSTR